MDQGLRYLLSLLYVCFKKLQYNDVSFSVDHNLGSNKNCKM